MNFPTLFKDAATKRGWTPAEAATRLHISGPYFSQIASGARKPPLERVLEWADILNLTGDDRLRFMLAASQQRLPDELAHAFDRMQSLSTRVSDNLDAETAAAGRIWLASLTDTDLATLPPYVERWRKGIESDSADEVEAVLDKLRKTAWPLRLDGTIDFRRGFDDPVDPLARWWRDRARRAEAERDTAARELAELRAQLRRLGAEPSTDPRPIPIPVSSPPQQPAEPPRRGRKPAFQIPTHATIEL